MGYFYLGEYGYAFRQLLPFLEQYNGDEKIELITYTSLCDLIELLWPEKYKLIKVESIISNINPESRKNNSGDDSFFIDKGHNNISSLSEIFQDNIFSSNDLIKTKIIYGEQCLNKKYISIFSRKRKHRCEKNIFKNSYLEWIKINYPNFEIVGHGLKGERGEFNIRYCENVYEQINVFNNSLFFLSDDSGIIDLSLMSGCDLILTSRFFDNSIDYKEYISKANYHNCNVIYFDDIIKGE